jgi:hypothetical protein
LIAHDRLSFSDGALFEDRPDEDGDDESADDHRRNCQ